MTKTIWSASDVSKAVKGKKSGDWTANSISIDSRTVEKDGLFIAIKGDKSDGHDYAAEALKNGASAAIVSKIPEGCDAKDNLILVQDTFQALQDLGSAARARTGATIIGVTGSVGKTGTKELLAAAFATQGQSYASEKSYNNHWGVPLSLAGMPAGTDYGIFEMGMNHAGEISPLSKQVKPDISIITTIAEVHIENFENGIEGIANAKAEIFDGMAQGGCAVLNADNAWFDYLKDKAKEKGLRIYGFGEAKDADARLLECLEAANGSRMKAEIMGEEITLQLRIPGRHIVMNTLSVLLAVKLAGGDLKKACEGLSKVDPMPGRGFCEYIDIGDSKNPVTLIDESYNASPEAMKAAFKVLALIDPGRGGRRIAILGDMYELGDKAAQMHKDLALPLQAANVQLVYTSGPLMKNLYDALPEDKKGVHEDDTKKLGQIVPDVLMPGDVVMVKGSRGGGEKPRMQLVVEALRAIPQTLKNRTIKQKA